MKNLRIAIFDLTDCEGCELQFLALREELAKEGQDLEIANWRLGGTSTDFGPFDITFIEGSPITDSDIEVLKQARKASKKIITLGTCAVLGGIQASIDEKQREEALVSVYGGRYKSKNKIPRPVSYYINADIQLPGCPVNPKELKKLLVSAFAGKKFTPAYYPVCLECKIAKNPCLYLEEGFCLGPVTKGGCGAPCPKAGLHCYGCFGPLPDANLNALKESAHKSEKEIEEALKLFFKNTDEYKKFKTKGR